MGITTLSQLKHSKKVHFFQIHYHYTIYNLVTDIVFPRPNRPGGLQKEEEMFQNLLVNNNTFTDYNRFP